MQNTRKRTHILKGFYSLLLPGSLCLVYLCWAHDCLSVFVSSSTPTHCVRAFEHEWGIMCECVQMEPIGEQECWRRACVCVSGAQEACSCMTQVPHGTLALAQLTTSPQAALVKRLSQMINTYTHIHTNHLLKFNFNICWPDKYYADWKLCLGYQRHPICLIFVMNSAHFSCIWSGKMKQSIKGLLVSCRI